MPSLKRYKYLILVFALVCVSIFFFIFQQLTTAHPETVFRIPEMSSYSTFSPDGASVLTVNSNVLKVWDAATGVQIGQFVTEKPVIKALYLEDTNHIGIIASESSQVYIWETSSANSTSHFTTEGYIFNGVYSREKDILYTIAFSQPLKQQYRITLNKWNVSSSEKAGEYSWRVPYNIALIPMTLSSDSNLLAIAVNNSDDDGTIYLWDTTQDRVLKQISLPTAVLSLAWSPRPNVLAVGGRDTILRIWDVSAVKEFMQIDHLNGPVNALTYTNNGCFILSGGNHQPTTIWNSRTGQSVFNLKDITSTGMVNSILFNIDNRFVISKIDVRDTLTTDVWNLNLPQQETDC
jgi:WD40 repeat protein